MFNPNREKSSADHLLRANAILTSMAAGVELISELAYATALPVTTVIRTAAIMADEQIIETTAVGNDVRLSLIHPMAAPHNGN